MGCIPIKKKSSSLNEQTTKAIPRVEMVQDMKNLKIEQNFLVQEGAGDPYELYEETKLLGEGAFGKVFKVQHKTSRVTRAMKIINKQQAAIGEEDEIALIKEIDILKGLDHPNIIKVYEYYNTKRKLYIVSELCTGGELFDKITRDKHFSEKVAAHVMKQLLSAVQFCHSNNIIHRDLKPENILIESEEECKKEFFTIKVIDFGTSEIKKNKMLDRQIGTPFYIAPEVLNNSYNEKCDIWSCGVIMYILLCGYPPFYGEEEHEIYAAVKSGKYVMDGSDWDQVSADAKDLIRNMLCMNIGKRYSAEQAINHIWFKKMKEMINIKPISRESLENISHNLKRFKVNQKLQQATLAFIVHNMTQKEDTIELRKAFMDFDENGDGRLTKEELYKGLTRIMTPGEARDEVNRIMEIIDVDKNGYIEYEEFLRASLNMSKVLTEQNLQVAFNMFDKDRSGKITTDEIRDVLGKEAKISDNVWKQIVHEIDGNGDGEVSFNEFKHMMTKIIDIEDK